MLTKPLEWVASQQSMPLVGFLLNWVKTLP